MTEAVLAEAYRVYRPDGSPATLDDVVAAMAEADVVFFGEQHDDPVAHYLEAALLQRAYARYGAPTHERPRPLALSLEMFERDVQPILDEYLAGLITERHFRRSSRPWDNYARDYAPLVEFAKAHDVPVLAANAPRRYVNRVSRLGPASLDTLTAWARRWLPPLPYPGPSPEYVDKWNALMAEMMAESTAQRRADSTAADTTHHGATHHGATDAAAPHSSPHAEHPHAAPADSLHAAAPDPLPERDPEEADDDAERHGGGYALEAQALWDAAMAHTVAMYLDATPDALVLHLAGSFHVEEGLGAPAQLDAYRPGTRRLVVVAEAAADVEAFDPEEHAALGDFVVLTDEALPRTFAEPSP